MRQLAQPHANPHQTARPNSRSPNGTPSSAISRETHTTHATCQRQASLANQPVMDGVPLPDREFHAAESRT